MDIIQKLARDVKGSLAGLEILTDEPMSSHTSFRIGGAAAAFAIPKSAEELHSLLGLLYAAGEEPLIIGNGTNLLVTDEPLARFVIKIGDGLSHVERLGTSICAGAGITTARLAALAQREGLSGLEFAHGIPGTVGGAVLMNAGAYGGEMGGVVKSVEYLLPNGSAGTLEGEKLGFSYRHSVFDGSDKIITSAVFELVEGDGTAILAKMEELSEKRRASQPLDKPSAGSTFKRPKNGFAAALIDEAGLKGVSVGGAGVSRKHAGFIVNNGGATFADVMALMEHVSRAVYKNFGITLEPEVRIIRNI